MPSGLEGFSKEAEGQARYFDRGIPGHAALLRTAVRLIDEDPITREALLGAWRERSFEARYERPLLFCASIHREVLRDPTHPLVSSLRGQVPVDPAVLAHTIVAPGGAVLEALRTRFVQTNEVTRAVAWRLALPPAWQSEPLVLVDLGCSAGLNLVADRLELGWRTPDGRPLELRTPERIVARVGLDRAPIDPRNAEEALWLRACLWPGQEDRRARLDAAIAAAEREDVQRVVADAAEMPARLEALTTLHVRGANILAFQSIFAEYLARSVRRRFEEGIRAWLLRYPGRALWAQLETAPKGEPGPADVQIHVAQGGVVHSFVVASSEYHPRVVVVQEARLASAHALCLLRAPHHPR